MSQGEKFSMTFTAAAASSTGAVTDADVICVFYNSSLIHLVS
jgi:hypothetical protein